jgi:hypothetical protein
MLSASSLRVSLQRLCVVVALLPCVHAGELYSFAILPNKHEVGQRGNFRVQVAFAPSDGVQPHGAVPTMTVAEKTRKRR